MSVTADVRLPGLDAVSRDRGDILEEASMRAALMMRRYVPADQGALRGSEPLASNYRAGMLVWSTPYAARQYYEPMRHTEQGTTDHWDEKFWRNDGAAWLEYVRSLYGKACS